MGIFTRFRDIVSANLNAMLDRAEDPEKMVRLMIQEMEDTLIEVKSSCAGFMAEQKRIERAIDGVRGEVELWDGRARLAVQKDRDDLARQALAEKQRFVQKMERLSEELRQTREMVAHTQEDIAQLEAKLADAREKQRSIIQRRAAAVNRLQAQTRIRKIDTTEAFAKFEAYESGIDRLEAEAHLTDSLRPKAAANLGDQFRELEHSDVVERELEELKKQAQGGGRGEG